MKHARSAHHHHRVSLFTVYRSVLAEISNVLVLKGVIFLLVEALSYLLAQHVDVGLVYVATLVNERNSIVYLDCLQLLLMLLPVLV